MVGGMVHGVVGGVRTGRCHLHFFMSPTVAVVALIDVKFMRTRCNQAEGGVQRIIG